jgi:hypothetical protein
MAPPCGHRDHPRRSVRGPLTAEVGDPGSGALLLLGMHEEEGRGRCAGDGPLPALPGIPASRTRVSTPVAPPALLLLIEALDTAEQAAGTKTTGLAAVRNGERDALWTALKTLKVFVQGLADLLTPEGAVALIEAAGMVVGRVPIFAKAVLAAKLAPAGSGIVHLIANATVLVGKTQKKRAFNWMWSLDGKTWTSAPSTPFASTLIAGLTLGSTYWFRVSVTIAKTQGEWSQPVSLQVA